MEKFRRRLMCEFVYLSVTMMMLLLTETTLFFLDITTYDSDATSSQKFALAGRVPGWLSNLPATASKPAASLRGNPSTSSIQPRTSYSKLTKGSTISSNVPPPLTPISTSNAGGFTEFNMYASDDDEDDEELAKPLSHITSNKAYAVSLILSI
jgi:hypothetical protein